MAIIRHFECCVNSFINGDSLAAFADVFAGNKFFLKYFLDKEKSVLYSLVG